MPNFVIKFHPDFFKDFKKFNSKEIKEVSKKIKEIKKNPWKKHLHVTNKCYTMRFKNFRIVYYVKDKEIWFLTLQKRKKVYEHYLKRFNEVLKIIKE